jgi:hypothetical protein
MKENPASLPLVFSSKAETVAEILERLNPSPRRNGQEPFLSPFLSGETQQK